MLACETVGPVLEVRVPGSRTPWSGLSKCSSLVSLVNIACDLCRVVCSVAEVNVSSRAAFAPPLPRCVACVCRSAELLTY